MKLSHPLVVLDLETTGTWIEKDRIIEIAMIKLIPDGKRETYLKRVNPGMPIPPEVSHLIGISDEDIKGAPPFRDIAGDVLAFLEQADVGGFHVERFDLPLLERELTTAGHTFDWRTRHIYDAQKVYHLHERRDLSNAYQFYCGKELTHAHTAMADTEAALEVLSAQVDKYGEGSDLLDVLGAFNYRGDSDFYGTERKFRWWNGELYPVFGKYAKRWHLKEIARKDPKYLQWIISKDFSDEVKDLAGDALTGQFPVREPAGENKKA